MRGVETSVRTPGTGSPAQAGAPNDAAWEPPGKDCGLCGSPSCEAFTGLLTSGAREPSDCPFFQASEHEDRKVATAGGYPVQETATAKPAIRVAHGHAEAGPDVLGNPWDFVLTPLPGEPSARKIVLPFRPDLVERWDIQRGDIVLGRPAGAGCPVQHVLEVVRADRTTGVLETWVVGPRFARDREVKDVVAYHMLGFEGLATDIRVTPAFGARHTFLPGFCMMHINHTGLVNMVLGKQAGLHIRLEDVRLLAGPRVVRCDRL
jgi:uncharacterized Fe-S cluster-containing protein